MALTINEIIEGDKVTKEDRLELVLAEGERILNRCNERLDRIENRQRQIEKMMAVIEGIEYYKEWKLARKGVI